ncbi:MAG: methyltransferase domain-containing protein [Flavobacteriales bacterium]|nr:methyltransferase domain-containing protein [Flavobacteriales bacterium]
MIFFREFNEMPGFEQIALDQCRGKILDVGAAAGCHALHLQAKGFEVVALDVSKMSCDVMRGRGVQHVEQQDIMDYTEGGFDTILLLMNGFGMGRQRDNTAALLNHLKSLLNPGGQIIGDSTDILYFYEQDDGSIKIPAERFYGEVLFELEYRGLKERFDWLYLDPQTLCDIAEEVNLEVEEIRQGDFKDYLAILKRP